MIDPRDSFSPALPIRSKSVVVGKFWLPAWWRWALLGLAVQPILMVVGIRNQVPVWLHDDVPRCLSSMLPANLTFEHIDGSVVFALAAMVFEVILILLIVHIRYNRKAETTIFRDRIELSRGHEDKQVIRWADVLHQGKRATDVWMETQGSGKSSFEMIRFDVLEEGRRKVVRLFAHLNPVGRIAPTYLNVPELRRAFLLALLGAMPSLRLEDRVYALCEIHPVTMRRSRSRKWLFRLQVAGMMLVLLAAMTGYANGWSLWFALGVGFAALVLFMLLAFWLQSLLFVSPEDERAVSARKRLFGMGKAPVRMADDYPSADMAGADAKVDKADEVEAWVDALIARRRPETDCPWHLLEAWQWSKLLGERPDLAPHCPWQKLEGEDWAFLLAEQPALAEHCRWQILSPSDWATLLASQPQFLATGAAPFRWEDFDGADWSELLGSQPAFSSHCDFTKLDGTDWALLLRVQPAFADRCSWEKLDEDDWIVLLQVQPQFRNHRTRGR